jgi:hypothetical protein
MVLTKSSYLSGLQCIKRLWIEMHTPHLPGSGSGVQAQLRAQGREVGVLARKQFTDGLLITGWGASALSATQAALAAGETCLFEAAFEHAGVYVRCDILLKGPDGGWTVIEVKSTTRAKQHHLHDLAVQQWVVQGAGLAVNTVELMHLNNRTCVYPKLDKLFVRVDVTKPVARLLPQVAQRVERLQTRLAGQRMPRVPIGPQCSIPHPCPATKHCWQDVPRHAIFTIPRITPDKLRELTKLGILRVQDIPADFPLSPYQWAYVRRVVEGKAEIAVDRVAQRLEVLEYPIYFLDFETYSYAVPQFDGMRPFQQLPFQYSVHVLEVDGTLQHREFLYTDTDDPRPALARQLVADIGPTGSVVVYHARFERTVLRELARALPTQHTALQGMVARLWDQLDVFRYDYLDPAFEGSNSIKRVLPALVPELSYDDLAVRRGDQAQTVWQTLIRSDDADLRAELAAGLRAYCGRDTLAMVAIHQVLTDLVARGKDA